jgi:hypothetical protein
MKSGTWLHRGYGGSAFIAGGVLLLVTGCAAAPERPRPEPEIRTVEVQIPVVVACPALARLGPEPAYPDTAEALRAAPNIYVRTQLLLAGRGLRIARQAAVEAALAACA